jgi:predicted DNA-binding transcriptional regulator AlpA
MSRAVPARSRRNTVEAITYDGRDLASMLKLCDKTIARLSQAGLIPGRIRIGGSVRYSRRLIDRWIEQGCPRP